MVDIRIPTENVKKEFTDILNIVDNKRVLFSGKYGLGKTTFLKSFFEENANLYETFHLYPTNYQINSTENIVELIKYDILLELLNKKEDILKENRLAGIKDTTEFFWKYLKTHSSVNGFLGKTLDAVTYTNEINPNLITNFLTKLGRPMKDLLKFDQEFQKYKKKYKNGEKEIVGDFFAKIQNLDVCETDYFSYFLNLKIKEVCAEKKSVLVLDDMDRIDPEHVFRILNVLTGYFEKEEENKFGFDYIIIVADYDNLKHIFQYKYGSKSDFSGYIDKFFSLAPFYFDNDKALVNMLSAIIKNIQFEEDNLKGALDENGYVKIFLSHFLKKCIEMDTVNLRELLKLTKYQVVELKKGVFQKNPFHNDFRSILNISIKIANLIFSNKNSFINNINEIKSNSAQKDNNYFPYDIYIVTLLRALNLVTSDNIAEPGKSQNWRTYDFKLFNGIKVDFQIEMISGDENLFFYDLLIEYINTGKFKQDFY